MLFNIDSSRNPPRAKAATQRYRDEYLVKEFFHCWKDFTNQQARLVESRRKRIMIDFRHLWFQDALSNPFYSYFEQPFDYTKKHQIHHQLAYRTQKRLVRTGREQPKDTMHNENRATFLPVLFNLPKHYLDRQISLHRRYQQIIDTDDQEKIFLKNICVTQEDILLLLRQRLKLFNRLGSKKDESILQEQVFHSALFEQGTIKDLDIFIHQYYTTLDEESQQKKFVSLPPIKSSRRSLVIQD